MIDFPSPILSVSVDVVKDLDGEDALYGMWTKVFTKCKQSLKDGRRLENISWRLWYREKANVAHDYHSSGSTSPALSEGRCASPMTPLSEDAPRNDIPHDSLLPIADPTARHSWHGDDHPPSPAVRRLSTASMPARPRSQPSQCVGSIILDILPGTMLVPPRPRPHLISTSASKPSVPVSSHPSSVVPQSVMGTSPLHQPSSPSIAQPRPVSLLPTLNLPTTPPNSGAPRVVVVNPTPHPTPPATPHPHHSTPASLVPAPTHLTPPVVRTGPACVTVQSRPRPAATSAASKPDAPVQAVAPESSAAVRGDVTAAPTTTPTTTASQSRKGGDETLKPSDRRFFLQCAESPDQDSPERGNPPGASKSPDPPEPSPSSGTSSHVKSEGIQGARRSVSRQGGRRGKDVARFTAARSSTKPHTQRQSTVAHRKAGTEAPKKTTFAIGSVSSNGTKSDAREHREMTATAVAAQKTSTTKQNQVGKNQQQQPHQQTAVLKKGLVMSTSSEYTTDSDDDSEWASEDASVEIDSERAKKEKERQKEETRLREAAEEAQRQRDMFAKVDRRSYTSLGRTRSGLLSQLLNPDPTIFPPDHPYRVKSLTDVTRLGRVGTPGMSGLAMSKSSAALPLRAQITPLTAQAQALVDPTNANGSADGNAYRPRGRPQGQEMEESESEEEAGENEIQLSRSLAQQRLAALADPNRRRASDQGVRQQGQLQQQLRQHQQMQEMQQQHAAMGRPTLTTVATAPIPLAHPYNLPAPAPPMTPRTTRRQMLSTELSESLRRNLLWERQVSKVNMLGGARRHGLLSNNLRPLTAVNGAQPGQQQQQPVDEREERRRAAVARNRSWADDYHAAGW